MFGSEKFLERFFVSSINKIFHEKAWSRPHNNIMFSISFHRLTSETAGDWTALNYVRAFGQTIFHFWFFAQQDTLSKNLTGSPGFKIFPPQFFTTKLMQVGPQSMLPDTWHLIVVFNTTNQMEPRHSHTQTHYIVTQQSL